MAAAAESETEEEVFDYIVSIPELDGFGLEKIDVLKTPMELSVRTRAEGRLHSPNAQRRPRGEPV